MIKKYLGKMLIALGCIIIIVAISLKIITDYKQKKIVDNYRDYISNMQNEDKSFNENKKAFETYTSQEQSSNIIGILSIHKLDLNVGIGEGVDNETLKYSVGHFSDTAMPGQKGNFCVIGHRSYTYGEFFNRLDEIEENDEIIVEYNGKEFKYKVTEIKVVKPEEISVLNQSEEEEITLITCTPIRVGSHRLIIKGIREQ
ncbi:class D sortase [Clostridium sp.]|uniref:class D sortase n=1 Tax=Clostridium sp. TaxID=1506 RepID=UPI002906196F|nr:class D sortase [Clostridium sp.]MDU4848554.1 class D sortase [Clostridium sp.]